MSIEALIFWGAIGSLVVISFVLRYLERERMAFHLVSAQATPADQGIVPHRAVPVRRDYAPSARWSPLALTVEGWRPIHKMQRDSAEIVVWRVDQSDGANGADWAYAVTVGRDDRQCRDCMTCTNDAIRWIQECEATAA